MQLVDRIKALPPHRRSQLRELLNRWSAGRRTSGNGASEQLQLVAYVVLRPGRAADPDALRAFLGARLPAYMVPARFVFLSSLPRTPNGKVDRRALPVPPAAAAAEKTAGPIETPVEQKLAEIWQEALGIDQVGSHDNFFRLGGQSLLALRVMARVRQAFQVEMPLRVLFESPTIAGLAAAIASQHDQGNGGPIRKVPRLNRGQWLAEFAPSSTPAENGPGEIAGTAAGVSVK